MQNPVAEQVVKVLKDSNNVLVTVKNNPSVDDLTAAIGLTLMLNHMGKHSITVFSGRVPSTIEFLQPEMAIDSNTDSLRDFIIALDKSKADKLRYKVEDNVVRIFITPYKTSISEKDLDFSQGDFNVDAVVALGVVQKEDFDTAITAHGRILHDATVVALTNHDIVSNIGAINWQEQQASSISEMIASISGQLGDNLVDGQIATALMTGIVAETDRFRNGYTTPQVLSISAQLMSQGANQQLIAEKLDEPDHSGPVAPLQYGSSDDSDNDGALEISHDEDEIQDIHIDDNGNLKLPEQPPSEMPASENQQTADVNPVEPVEPLTAQQPTNESEEHSFIPPVEPPKLFAQDDSGTVTAQPLLDEQPSVISEDEKSMFSHGKKVIQPLADGDPQQSTQNTTTPEPVSSSPQTLTDLEQAVDSPHVSDSPQVPDEFVGMVKNGFVGDQTEAKSDVEKAINDARQATEQAQSTSEGQKPAQHAPETPAQPDQVNPADQPPPQVVNPNSPPPVPPPLMPPSNQPQFFDADGKNDNPLVTPTSN